MEHGSDTVHHTVQDDVEQGDDDDDDVPEL